MDPVEVVRPDPRFFAEGVIIYEKADKTRESIVYTFDSPPPKELMDQAQQLAGDALAKVTVSSEVSSKDFGNGVSCMVVVSLSCNQDQTTIHNAITLAGQMARHYAKEQRVAMEPEYQQIMAERQRR